MMEGGVPAILWYLLAVGFVVGGVLMAFWWTILAYRGRMRTLEVLRLYAERGEEPPPALTALVVADAAQTAESAPHAHHPPRSMSRRSYYLDQVITFAGLTAASAGIAWWRIADGGGPEWLEIAAVILAVFFGAATVGNLTALAILRGRDE